MHALYRRASASLSRLSSISVSASSEPNLSRHVRRDANARKCLILSQTIQDRGYVSPFRADICSSISSLQIMNAPG